MSKENEVKSQEVCPHCGRLTLSPKADPMVRACSNCGKPLPASKAVIEKREKILAKLRKQFEDHHANDLELARGFIRDQQQHIKLLQSKAGMRSAGCCPRCERFIGGGSYCPNCGAKLVVFDLRKPRPGKAA